MGLVIYYVLVVLVFCLILWHFGRVSYQVYQEYKDAVYRRDDVFDIWLDALVNGLKR
jgi:hypothetical protein